jgi:hypothetical protein
LNSNLLKIKTMHKDFWNPDYSQSLSISIYMATAYSLLMVLVLVIINILLLFFIDISEVTDTIFITFTDYILGVIAAPIIETLILILIIEILKLMKIKNIFINASLAAIPFGFFHVDPITIDDQLLRLIDSVIEFLMTGWAFFVFAYLYLKYHRDSFSEAFIATAVPHAIHNFVLLSIVFILHFFS